MPGPVAAGPGAPFQRGSTPVARLANHSGLASSVLPIDPSELAKGALDALSSEPVFDNPCLKETVMIHRLSSTTQTIRSLASSGALIGGLLLGAQAHSQVAAPFVGSWKATWQTDKKSYDAVMTVSDTGGTWQTATLDKSNPCAGREVPMKVESSSATEVQFQLRFSDVMSGCQNVNVALKLAPDGTVTGTRSKYELTLHKK